MSVKTSWKTIPIAAIDVETTGFDPKLDRVIEVGIVHMQNGEVTGRYSRLVNPSMPVPKAVRDLTGIGQSDVDRAEPFSAIANEVAELLKDRCIVAYNLSFDRGFVAAELERCGLSWPEGPTLDPLIFSRALLTWLKSKRLGDVAAELGVDLHEAHRARDDAEAAGRILYAFGDRLPEELEQLLTLQAQWEGQQDQSRAIRRGRALDLDGSVLGGGFESGLGPAYIYGDEVDPYRALVRGMPDARTKQIEV
jgi:DNA polymerase III alpha subunit (gram-positive type)